MKIGVVAGSFDIIHVGYIHMFNECKQHCDKLIVLLHSDPSVERKEKLKPIHTVSERKFILSSLKQIDQIISYKLESDLLALLKTIEIDVRFLGDDYKDKEDFTGSELKVPIHYIERSHGWSTTKYKRMISNSL